MTKASSHSASELENSVLRCGCVTGGTTPAISIKFTKSVARDIMVKMDTTCHKCHRTTTEIIYLPKQVQRTEVPIELIANHISAKLHDFTQDKRTKHFEIMIEANNKISLNCPSCFETKALMSEATRRQREYSENDLVQAPAQEGRAPRQRVSGKAQTIRRVDKTRRT